jgi:hypothetical protein
LWSAAAIDIERGGRRIEAIEIGNARGLSMAR